MKHFNAKALSQAAELARADRHDPVGSITGRGRGSVAIRATVSFSVNQDGRLVADVATDDPLARATITKAIEEFWAVDRQRYDAENEAKWKRRLA